MKPKKPSKTPVAKKPTMKKRARHRAKPLPPMLADPGKRPEDAEVFIGGARLVVSSIKVIDGDNLVWRGAGLFGVTGPNFWRARA